ncbi:hypothetical protein [Streptomyces sp. NPDC004296]|uniref:hypothetical protein n=1 Tax=Streptomyces sp. NPDC004296 TaxID=3364697 RepID=UPI0036BE0790
MSARAACCGRAWRALPTSPSTAEPARVTMPEFAPPREQPAVDLRPFTGSYRCEGLLMAVTDRHEGERVLRPAYEGADGPADTFEPPHWNAGTFEPLHRNLVPVSDTPAKSA